MIYSGYIEMGNPGILHVSFLIDSTGSMPPTYFLAAARAIVEKLKPSFVTASLWEYWNKDIWFQREPPTTDYDKIQAEMDVYFFGAYKNAFQAIGDYGGVIRIDDEWIATQRLPAAPRNIVLIFTNGEADDPALKQQAINRANQFGWNVYGCFFNTGFTNLKDLCNQTGGKYVEGPILNSGNQTIDVDAYSTKVVNMILG